MKTIGPVYNEKNSHRECCSAAGLLRGGAKEGLHVRPWNTQDGDTKTGPQTSCGTADTQLWQSSTNENIVLCSGRLSITNTFLSLAQGELALLEILNSSTVT